MNLLLIHQYFLEKEDGGGSRFNEMTKTWASKGHHITVLAGMVHYNTGKKYAKYKGKYSHVEKGFYGNVDVVRSHVSESYNTNFIGRLWAYFSFVFSSVYTGIFICKTKVDVIVVTSPPLFVGITAYLLSKIKHVPFVFEIRDLWPESAIDTGVLTNGVIIKFAYWFEKFLYKKALLINVLTPAFKQKLITIKGVPENKILFIPNAADFSIADSSQNFNAQEFKKTLGFDNNFVITYVGAHGVANHLIQIVETAELLCDTNVVFQLIGAGMQKEMLKDEVKKRNLNNVVFVDPVPKSEIFKYILASDIGTSVLKKVDTFKTIYSNKTFDYMSCKKPVLLLIDGVSRELIEEADCGWYVEPENISEIAQKIKEIIKENQIDKKGENGYNYAKKFFDRDVLALKYLEQIEKNIKHV
jgi:glycosyltransferase involved in cell wall biosynthesis